MYFTEERPYDLLIFPGTILEDIDFRSITFKVLAGILSRLLSLKILYLTLHFLRYSFKTDKAKSVNENLGNIEKLIHSRVLGIERGVESFEQAFAGYKGLAYKADTGFFAECNNLESLKSKRNELIKKYHPDVLGGKDDIWVAIQHEYEMKESQYTKKQ